MTPEQAILHFRTQRTLAEKLGLTQPAVANWIKRGRIPDLAQLKIQKLTRGKLKADPEIYGG